MHMVKNQLWQAHKVKTQIKQTKMTRLLEVVYTMVLDTILSSAATAPAALMKQLIGELESLSQSDQLGSFIHTSKSGHLESLNHHEIAPEDQRTRKTKPASES